MLISKSNIFFQYNVIVEIFDFLSSASQLLYLWNLLKALHNYLQTAQADNCRPYLHLFVSETLATVFSMPFIDKLLCPRNISSPLPLMNSP